MQYREISISKLSSALMGKPFGADRYSEDAFHIISYLIMECFVTNGEHLYRGLSVLHSGDDGVILHDITSNDPNPMNTITRVVLKISDVIDHVFVSSADIFPSPSDMFVVLNPGWSWNKSMDDWECVMKIRCFTKPELMQIMLDAPLNLRVTNTDGSWGVYIYTGREHKNSRDVVAGDGWTNIHLPVTQTVGYSSYSQRVTHFGIPDVVQNTYNNKG